MVAMPILLVGFMFYGRSFAYIGISPLFISEVVLALGMMVLIFGRSQLRVTGIGLWVWAFIGLGLLRTLPYIGTYRVDALRDAATWYYALFAFIVAGVLTPARFIRVLRLFARVLPIVAIWLVIMSVFFRFAPTSLRNLGEAPFPIFFITKPGDRAVVLVALGAFMLVGLYSKFRRPAHMPVPIFWTLWGISVVFVIVQNRGGMLGIAIAFAFIVLLRPTKQLFQLGAIGTLLIILLFIVDPTIDIGGSRQMSMDQIQTNIMSIFSNETAETGSVQGTKDWRLSWWQAISQNTIGGNYFWSGQGFGINLADEYGYAVDAHGSLRSPHSIHMTVLARMGVPGLLLWIGINLRFVFDLIRTAALARRVHNHVVVETAVWLLAIWAASIVNGSFDVYLESPYGAIPFWCVIGAGITLPVLLKDGEHHAHPSSA